MNSYISTFSSISVIILLIGFVVILKALGLFKKEDGALFSKIVIQVTLPATIFLVLSHAKSLELDYLLISFYMLSVEVIVLFLVWLVGKKLSISSRELGTLMLVSAFGSSALLGYVIIAQIFPENNAVMSEAVMISELGVGIGLFVIGTMVAIFFGESSGVKQTPLKSFVTFLKSPIFLAIVFGILYSFLSLPLHEEVFKEFFSALSFVSAANTFFVVLSVGVLLEFTNIMSIIKLVLIAIFFKLFVSPFLIYLLASTIPLESWQLEVALIESAMPSAMLSVVLAARYGCDAKLASKLVFITTLISMISITLISSLY